MSISFIEFDTFGGIIIKTVAVVPEEEVEEYKLFKEEEEDEDWGRRPAPVV